MNVGFLLLLSNPLKSQHFMPFPGLLRTLDGYLRSIPVLETFEYKTIGIVHKKERNVKKKEREK